MKTSKQPLRQPNNPTNKTRAKRQFGKNTARVRKIINPPKK